MNIFAFLKSKEELFLETKLKTVENLLNLPVIHYNNVSELIVSEIKMLKKFKESNPWASNEIEKSLGKFKIIVSSNRTLHYEEVLNIYNAL